VLGCQVERVREELGLTHLRAGAAMIDLVAVDGELGRRGGAPAASEGRNVDHFCLRIEPFDAAALVSHLTAHGVTASEIKSRFGAEGTGPSLYITDPEGNGVELKGPSR
jgi:glyoxylase I family protein